MDENTAKKAPLFLKIVLICAFLVVVGYTLTMVLLLYYYPTFSEISRPDEILTAFELIPPSCVISSVFSSILAVGIGWTFLYLLGWSNRKLYGNVALIIVVLILVILLLLTSIAPYLQAGSIE